MVELFHQYFIAFVIIVSTSFPLVAKGSFVWVSVLNLDWVSNTLQHALAGTLLQHTTTY